MNINLFKTYVLFQTSSIVEVKTKVEVLITLSKGVRMLCNHSHISTSLAEELRKMRKPALSMLFATLSSDGFELYLLVIPVLDAVRMYPLLVLSLVNI